MRFSLTTLTAPAGEPVTRQEMKDHARIDATDDATNALVDALITAARDQVENYTRRSLVKRTLELRLDCFYEEIRLPRGPVVSVTKVEYVNSGGTLTTLPSADYQVDLYSVPARIVTAYGVTWPVTKLGELNAVIVTYVAGYDVGSPDNDYGENVPAAIKAALKLVFGDLWENREATLTQPTAKNRAVEALLAPWEIRDFTLEQ